MILNTMNFKSKYEDGSTASISSTGSLDTVQFAGNTVKYLGSQSGTVRVNSSDTVQFSSDTVKFHEADDGGSDTVRFNLDSNESDVRPGLTRNQSLSSHYSSSPQVLSESEEQDDDEETEDEDATMSPPDDYKPKYSLTPTGSKETRSVGTQTDLPLDL